MILTFVMESESYQTHYIYESDIKKNEKSKDTTVSTPIFTHLSSKADLLMSSLGRFYHKQDNVDILLPIVNGESPLSLRVIDWFVTNYAKDKSVMYDHTNEKGQRIKFIVYLSYKSQLKAYSKKTFDPFCRRERILFFIETNEKKKVQIRTTVGQLNFFRWAIENHVIGFIKEHLQVIEKSMYVSFHGDKKPGEEPKKEISISVPKPGEKDITLSATSKVNKHNVTITVKFD